MAANCYIEQQDNDVVRTTNDSGAAVVNEEFCIVGPYAAIATESIANLAEGGFEVAEGRKVSTATLETGEDTFGTIHQEVYWNNTNKTFSDTETAGYYHVGYLLETKNSNGYIRFEKTRYWTLITT